MLELLSQIPGIAYPRILTGESASLYHLLQQLMASEKSSAEALRQRQFIQAGQLFSHAYRSIPFYRERLAQSGWTPGSPVTEDLLLRIPILDRATLQAQSDAIRTPQPFEAHGKVGEGQSSGSTGQPVRFQGTHLTRLMWNALTLRHYLWHTGDLGKKLCAIRPQKGEVNTAGAELNNWGRPFNTLFRTGPASNIDCRQDAGVLLQWVSDQRPSFLLSLPSTLEAMALVSRRRPDIPIRLEKLFTYAETLRPETRKLVEDTWQAPVVDMYSAQEVGYIALECPVSRQLHVQSESLIVEVLDSSGRPCKPGEIGRIVLTSLLNFASPLIRYEIQDYAEVGETCACGRGLPVLKRVMGRVRNLIALPNGGRVWPVMYSSVWSHVAPIRQLQLVQKTPQLFHARVLIDRPLSESEQTQLIAGFRDSLGYPFEFEFQYLEQAIVNPNGKFESIISEVR